MATSTELMSELTATELVMLKDGIDLEVERLDRLARQHIITPEGYPQASAIIGMRNAKFELAWKLSAVIESKIEEERA
jgi:hypothetical protein